MIGYDYKVVPAPSRGEKAKGVKGPEARFAHTVETLINEMASEGWEYQRAETLPSEERQGLTSSVTVWRTVLVFRRARAAKGVAAEPLRIAAAPGPAPQPGDADPLRVPGPAPQKPEAPHGWVGRPPRTEAVTNLSSVLRAPHRIDRKDS